MDADTARELAEIKMQLAELRAALSTTTPEQAERKVLELATTVTYLVTWAQTVTPAFVPPA